MASPLTESWIFSTMLIENQWSGMGTGFLVGRRLDDGSGRVFLVTNKHVLNEEESKRRDATQITVYLNVEENGGPIKGEKVLIILNLDNGTKRWREHADKDVDVLAFDVTPLIAQYPQIKKRWAESVLFFNESLKKEHDITMGDDVVVIGYPMGLRHRTSNLPLMRNGSIATNIGESLEDEVEEENGTKRKRVLRGFLIDGGVVPGSSGSPVILKPVSGRVVNRTINLSTPPPILLGIVAETRYAPIKYRSGQTSLSFANLGLAFDAETIKETIDLFFIDTNKI